MIARGLLPLTIAGLCTWAVQGQVLFTGTYTESFDALGPSGTAWLEGWGGFRYAGSGTIGADLNLSVSTGSATGGGLYNLGLAGETDRAVGSLASSSTIPGFGLRLRNGTGGLLDDLSFSGVMEQWRSGSSATVDESMVCEYSLDATSLFDPSATWIRFSGLDLRERLTGSTSAGAINGNLAENQLQMTAALHNIGWADQEILTLRWLDTDNTGSDGIYALDDFRVAGVASVPEPGSISLCLLGAGAVGWLRRRWRRMPPRPAEQPLAPPGAARGATPSLV